jgi:hypothetical protein
MDEILTKSCPVMSTRLCSAKNRGRDHVGFVSPKARSIEGIAGFRIPKRLVRASAAIPSGI